MNGKVNNNGGNMDFCPMLFYSFSFVSLMFRKRAPHLIVGTSVNEMESREHLQRFWICQCHVKQMRFISFHPFRCDYAVFIRPK